MAESVKESAWMKQFLDELQLFHTARFEILEDSQPCINALRKNVSDSRFRHIRTHFHFIRGMVWCAWCYVVKINTHDQCADLTTKLLPPATVQKHTSSVLGIRGDKTTLRNTG